jgi:predicted RNA-binding Zn ribbon-like protein
MSDFYGGVACLDFANTLDGRLTERPEEHLTSYAGLVDWSRRAGLLDDEAAHHLERIDAPSALTTALALREAIFRIFAAVGRGEPVPAADLAVLQGRYAEAMAAARLVLAAPGWEFDGGNPDRAWWPVAVSAVRLIVDGPLDRVKICAAEAGCAGLFLDTSKNRSRRWCTMDGCGVAAKIQRQATRRRAAR